MKKLIFVLVFFVLSLNLFGQSYYGKILRLNTNGAMGWEDINSVLDRAPSTDTNHSFWLLEGNTLSSNEFIGTKNSYDLIFKTNNAERLRIAATGDISILYNINLTNNGTAKQLRFYESIGSGANYTAIQAQNQASDLIYTLPATAGTNGQVLSTDGSGNLSWASVSDNSNTNELITAHSYTAGSRQLRITEAGANWDVTLPTFSTTNTDAGLVAGSNGQTAYFLRGDNSWQPVITSESDPLSFHKGGNSFGAIAVLGTSDAYGIDIKTNNTNRLRIAATGDISILYNINLTNAGAAKQLRFYESSGSGTNYTAIQAQTQAGDITYTLPATAGTNGQVLSTDGSGNLSWASVSDNSNTNELITAHSYTAGSRQLRITEAGHDWDVTLPTFSTASADAGLVAGSNEQTAYFLRGDNSWQPVITSESDPLSFHKGGNSFGAIAVLGTSDAYGIDIKTNNTNRLQIAATGEITILNNVSLTNSGSATQLRFYEPSGSGTHYTALQAQTQAADITYTLPAVAGTNGQVLSTDGSGNLSWASISDNSSSNELITAHSYTAGSRQLRITEAGANWDVTLPTFSTTNTDAGLVAGSNGQTTYFLRGDNSWQPVITSESDPHSFHQGGNSFGAIAVLGTSDAYGIDIKTNNAERLRIASTGEITILNNVSLTNSGSATQLRFYEPSASGANYTGLQAQTQAGDITYTLPATAGTNGQVLSTDGSGSLSWITDSTGWGLTGNTGTVDGTNFIGTNDNVALSFKVNSQKAGRIGTSADGSVFLGYQAGANDDLSSNQNVFVGYQAGYSNTTGYNNTANGTYALYSNTAGYNNTADGFAAFNSNTTGYNNTAIGTTTLNFNSTGYNNTANGNQALYSNTTGFENTANGNQALYYNTTGSNNVALGDSAGYGASGINFNQCTFVGSDSYPTTTRTNVTMLGYGIADAQCTGDNQVILGNSSVTGFFVGTGSLTTTANLPNMYYDASTGQIMRSTASLGGSGWGLTGNTGTIDGTNFIGTTDNVALNFKVNNQESGRIGTSADGSVFLGYQAGANDDLSNNQNVFVGYKAGYSNTTGYFNTANGQQSLYSNTTGSENTANGYNALHSNTTGFSNTANGHQSLYWNTTGSENTANGSFALLNNTTGLHNTANGHKSLYSNTTGYENTANGNAALFSNTTGFHNTANGYQSLYSNTTGSNNTANGFNALYNNTEGNQNTATGNAALYSNTTGSNNTANGFNALYNNTEGNQNTATGNAALYSNTTGYENTANGQQSLYWNTTGSNNTANGQQSLYWNTTGSNNTANGSSALRFNATGNRNTANGSLALYNSTTGEDNTANGSYALYSNTTGYSNTANGANALYFNSTGNNNVALGYNAGYGASGVNFNQCTFVGSNSYPTQARSNVTMLGYGITNAQCTGDNQILLGNTSVSQIRAAVTSITAYSDGRYKTNIENNVHGLDFVMKLKPITYSTDPRKLHKIWGTADSLIEKMDVSDAMSKRYIGFIAQDVEQAANDCGFAFPGIDVPKNEKEAYTLRYVDFIMPMVKSIQEQQKMIEQLQTENKELKTENQEMKLKIDHITQLEQENQLLQTQMATMMQEIEKIKQEMANKDAGSNNNQEFFGEKK